MQSEYTEDSIYRKEIKILQPVAGYRFSLDSLLLAHFISTREQDRILEVGAGSGVVTILVSIMKKFGEGFAVEIQPDLAQLCRKNLERNGVKNVEVLESDFNEIRTPSHSLDLIYSNPPYRKAGSGKLNPSQQKSIARHEIKLKLEDLFRCSRNLLKEDGRLTLILPDYREPDFTRLAQKHAFHVIERQYVHSYADHPPAFVLTTASIAQTELCEYPRIVIYEKPGEYTEQMKLLL